MNDSTTMSSRPATGAKRRSRILALSGAMAAGIVLGAAGIAGAAMMGDRMMGGPGGWRHHGPDLGRIQNFVRMSLDSVAATSEQEAKVHDIIASAFTDLAPKPEDRAAFAKQAMDLLRAPALDKAGLEKLRADFVAGQDTRSKRFLDAVEQAADVLTPDQRTKLAERASFFLEHRPMMGGDHRPPMAPPMDRPMDGDDNHGHPGGDGDNHGLDDN